MLLFSSCALLRSYASPSRDRRCAGDSTRRPSRRSSPSVRDALIHSRAWMLLAPSFLLPCVHAELSSSRGAAAHRAGRSSSPRCDSSRPRPPRFAPHLLEPGRAPARAPGTPPSHAMAATPPSSRVAPPSGHPQPRFDPPIGRARCPLAPRPIPHRRRALPRRESKPPPRHTAAAPTSPWSSPIRPSFSPID